MGRFLSLRRDLCTSSSISRYDASRSSTFRPVEATKSDFHIEYMDDTIIEGTHGYDTLTLGDIEIPNQVFAQASSVINNTKLCNEVGLLGLGLREISSQNFPALLSNLKEQQITMFSLYLTDHNDYQLFMNKTTDSAYPIPGQPPASAESEFTVGGVNPKRYRNCLRWHELGQFRAKGKAFKGCWDFALDGVKVGSTEIPSSSLAMVDSGATWSVSSQETVGRIAKKLGVKCFVCTDSVEDFLEEVQCDDPFGYDFAATYCSETESSTSLTFVADGKSYHLTSSEPFREIEVDSHSPICTLNLEGVPGFPGWLLGMNFLRKYYTVFDFGRKRLGFAEATTNSATVCKADSSYFIHDIPDDAKTITSTPSASPTSYYTPTPHYATSSNKDVSGALSGFIFFVVGSFAGFLFVRFFCVGLAIGYRQQAPAPTTKGYLQVRTTDPEECTREVELSPLR
ncbi:unnamed protein product [Cylindrotheca closterium]|uniref:Peptidase A1 domain-containing protein n=1 Tax=Cylindrotheca closterium TaxID=2856 RepID=A0AAD2JN49_9STRA|nr:unnamed protein product [Cylindrotheca closterium]